MRCLPGATGKTLCGGSGRLRQSCGIHSSAINHQPVSNEKGIQRISNRLYRSQAVVDGHQLCAVWQKRSHPSQRRNWTAYSP